ncbi:TetR/AcrR family transcriptional regulator [Nocardia heshunensis]
MAARNATRAKMLLGGVELLQRRGAAGVTIDAILSRTGAPRGSVYHHFPRGRRQILAESLDLAGDTIAAIIEQALRDGPIAGIDRFGEFWKALLEASDFTAGCPVVAVAVGGSDDDRELGPKVAAIVERWRASMLAALVAAGVSEKRAAPLVNFGLAATEGAVVLCRTDRSTQPLDDVMNEFKRLLGTIIP